MKRLSVLVTSGGTKVEVDMVRSITNMSRGTFGSAIAKCFLEKGHIVDFLMAEGSRSPFKFEADATNKDAKDYFREIIEWHLFVSRHMDFFSSFSFRTFEDYQVRMVEYLLKRRKYDIIILACAVSDYGISNYVDGKIRSGNAMSIELTPYPKIISSVREMQSDTFLVGFKLLVKSEYNELISAASESLVKNKCDMIVANDLNDIRANDHKLFIVEPPEKTGNKITRYGKEECFVYHKTLPQILVGHILDSYDKKHPESKIVE